METKKASLTKKKNKGFSLVELMVVVAIIGVLATIAVPQLNQWVAKARQAEAKSSLSGLYTAMKGFYAENQLYFGNFNAIGLRPEGSLRYGYGFSKGTDLPSGVTASDSDKTEINTAATGVCTGAGSTCTVLTFPGSAQPQFAAGTWSLSSFTAEATGDIDGDTDPDTWTINETKTIANAPKDL